ncbi:MAG: hypothetical protein IKG46_00355 [Solobacterium sp.]|nr:hypothetical protein [Solobacterium sp.]
MNKNIKIEYPNEEIIDHSIQKILDTSMQNIPSGSVIRHRVSETIGFRYLFFGMKDTLSLILICVVILYMSLFLSMNPEYSYIYLYGFILSPIPFLLFQCLSVWKDHSIGMTETKLTFKYRGKEVMCTQMIIMTIASILMSTVFSVLCSMNPAAEIPLFQLCIVNYLGLLLYSVGTLLIVLRSVSFLASYIMPMIWMFVSICFLFDPQPVNGFLMTLPRPAAIIIIFISLLVYTTLLIQEYRSIYRSGGEYAAN